MDLDQLTKSLAFGGGTDTNISTLTIIFLIIACILILVTKKNSSAYSIFLSTSIIFPLYQHIVIFDLNFPPMRILLLAAWLRIFSRNRTKCKIDFNYLDVVFLLWVLSSIVTYSLLWEDVGAFINRLGFAYNAIGVYFLGRLWIRQLSDIYHVISTFIFVSIFVSIFMLLEHMENINYLSLLGGGSGEVIYRAEKIRARGSFAHPITAGTLGAILLPLFIGMTARKDKMIKAYVGIIAALIITFSSASSGPIIALLAGVTVVVLWPARKYVRYIIMSSAIIIFLLHILMKAPVWALIARAAVIQDSTSYHRYLLLDQFITRIDEWWLIGTKNHAHWGWMMWDAINQYVAEGIHGGIITLFLFVCIIYIAMKLAYIFMLQNKYNRIIEYLAWGLYAALFANVINFFGITYFDQIIVIWFTILSIAAAIPEIRKPNITDSELLNSARNS